jgi:tetratricopeptide (TPR) repeat protein
VTARTDENFEQFGVYGHALEYMTHAKVLWNNLSMKLFVPLVVTAALLGGAVPADAQQSRQGTKPAPPAKVDPVAQAYDQFLLAHRLKEDDDADGAMAAYKRAMALDPKSATIVAELADLYMRQNRAADAITAADQALKIDPENRDAHRVLGTVYGSLGTAEDSRASQEAQRESLRKGIEHLERAVGPASARVQADVNVRAMLARLYVANEQYNDAIPVLAEIVKQEPGWLDGASLLVQAYVAAGRGDDAVRWLEDAVQNSPQLYPALADLYARARRYSDASAAYESALKISLRSVDLRIRYAGMLLGTGVEKDAVRARDVLREAVEMRAPDDRTLERALLLLAQAERRTGELDASERTSRRVISQNRRNPRAYVALAETLEERHKYQDVADVLAPAVSQFRSDAEPEGPLSMLLPHLGFAYQQLGQFDKAVAALQEAHKITGGDTAVAFYLIQAQLSAKKYSEAVALARQARLEQPDDLRLARLEAEGLRLWGKGDEAVAVLEQLTKRQAANPMAHVALAQIYQETNRGAQAVKVLQDARTRFPEDTSITFELGAVLEKQKKYSDAEVAFRQVIAQEPEHGPALNYLGYMLAERGERLSESVDLIKRALQTEPDNGSYLDSLGWAYFKDGKFDLAAEHLKRAADQLLTNSLVQEHYGDALFRLGRYDDAIAAWSRALSGDREDVDQGGIDKKIKSAKQKLPRR